MNPVVIDYPEGAAGLSGSRSLDDGTDYIVRLNADRPTRNTAGLSICGGRNVVVIGGTIDVGAGNAGARRAGYLQVPGQLYIEGVRFTSSSGSLTEGLDIAAGSSRAAPDTVTLQNISIDVPLVGTYATNHADVIQAWAGPRVLRIDGLSATTGYQGFFLLPTQHAAITVDPGGWDLRHITLTGTPAAYLLWRDGGSYPIRADHVFVSGSRMANGGLWPDASAWAGVTVGSGPAYGSAAGVGYLAGTSP